MSGSAASSDVLRIFVSHSHEDDEYCRAFVDELRRLCGERGAVWYDEHNLTSGELMREIQRQLHQRPIFVVIFTQASLRRSQWVADECAWAYQLYRAEPGRTCLPVVGGPIERSDFIPDWLYLEGFRRIEAPGMQPYPPAEAARRTYAALTVTSERQILPRERFPERLERLGFVAQLATDPATGKEVPFIRPPLCPVPAGPFLMGSDPMHSALQEWEQPPHEVRIADYQIGTFPVTVAEYACFVAAGHVATKIGPSTYSVDWKRQLPRLDHPVIGVTWYDARDYAAWLASLTGHPWKLPSEAQWEKAARWDAVGNYGHGVSRMYPWGDRFEAARCNTYESGVKMTTAVGSYGPEDSSHNGSSPCGAQDMVGNVVEWTSTLYKPYLYSETDGRESPHSTGNRVLRGCSWTSTVFLARAACRSSAEPGSIHDAQGFRVALLSAG